MSSKRKQIDNNFFKEFSDLCERFGVNPAYKYDNFSQLIIHTRLKLLDDEETYIVMTEDDYEEEK